MIKNQTTIVLCQIGVKINGFRVSFCIFFRLYNFKRWPEDVDYF